MAIIRISRKKVAEANRAREAALLKDRDFRLHDEQCQRLLREVSAREEGKKPS